MLAYEIGTITSKDVSFCLDPRGLQWVQEYLDISTLMPAPTPLHISKSHISNPCFCIRNNSWLYIIHIHEIFRLQIINIIVTIFFRYLVEEIKKREGFKLLMEVSNYGIVQVILSVNSDVGSNFLICYISWVFVLQT